jgi:phage terminase large subunit-like protein
MRKKPIVQPFALGKPPRPKGLTFSVRRAWNSITEELLAGRKLSQSDGELLLKLIQARSTRHKGTGQAKADAAEEVKRLEEIWTKREPFPEVRECPAEEAKPSMALEAFLVSVQNVRDTFKTRLIPSETVCRTGSDSFSWTEGHAATIARQYAQQVTQGDIVAGKLVRCACARFLSELETGHERGLYFDPDEAAVIATWFAEFGIWKLQPWQTFCIVQLFAWKKPSGLRRFSRFWLSVGRKNGKSALLGMVGLFCLIADHEDRAQIFSAATKRDQSRITWADAEYTVQHVPQLRENVKAQRYILSVENSGSTFEYLGADAHLLDGLRPHCCLIDELHEHKDDAVVKRLQSGTLSRPQPLLLFATTAGEDRDSWCYSQHEIFERILLGTTEEFAFSDSWLLYIAQMDEEDSPEDETKWLKSNPSLGVTLTYESLRTEAAALASDPASVFSFRRFHCNIWNSIVLGHSLPQDKIAACVGVQMPAGGAWELRNKVLAQLKADRALCFGGFDLGLSDDLAAFVLLCDKWRTGKLTHTGAYDMKTAVVPWFFVPSQRIIEHEKNWRVPLQQWIREGFVTIAGEELIDLDIVEKTIKQVCSECRCPVIGFDKWKSEIFFSKLHAQKVANCVAVPQLPSFLTSPSRELKTAVLNGTFAHFGNPVYKWMLSNVDLEPDEKHGGIKPAKSGGDRRKKIDGVQATVTAWQVLLDPENVKYTRNAQIFAL